MSKTVATLFFILTLLASFKAHAECDEFFKGKPFIDVVGPKKIQVRVTFLSDGREIREPLSSQGSPIQLTWRRTADGYCGQRADAANEVCYIIRKIDRETCATFYQKMRLGTWTLTENANAITQEAPVQQSGAAKDDILGFEVGTPMFTAGSDAASKQCHASFDRPQAYDCPNGTIQLVVTKALQQPYIAKVIYRFCDLKQLNQLIPDVTAQFGVPPSNVNSTVAGGVAYFQISATKTLTLEPSMFSSCTLNGVGGVLYNLSLEDLDVEQQDQRATERMRWVSPTTHF